MTPLSSAVASSSTLELVISHLIFHFFFSPTEMCHSRVQSLPPPHTPPSQVPISFTALLETYIFNWRHAMWRRNEKNVLLKLYKCKTCMRLKGEVRLTLWCVPWILRRQWQFPCKSWALHTTKVNNKCEACFHSIIAKFSCVHGGIFHCTWRNWYSFEQKPFSFF